MALSDIVGIRLDHVLVNCGDGEHHEPLYNASADEASDCDAFDGDEVRSSSSHNSCRSASDGEAFHSDEDEALPIIQQGDTVAVVQGLFAGETGATVIVGESDVQRQGYDDEFRPLQVKLQSGNVVPLARNNVEIAGTGISESVSNVLELGSSECADSDTEVGDLGSDSDSLDFFHPLEHACVDGASKLSAMKTCSEDPDSRTCDSANFNDANSKCQGLSVSRALGNVVYAGSQDSAGQASEGSPSLGGRDSQRPKRDVYTRLESSGFLKLAACVHKLQDPPLKRARTDLPAVPETTVQADLAEP